MGISEPNGSIISTREIGFKALDKESEESGEVVQCLTAGASVKVICKALGTGRKGAEVRKETEKGSKRENQVWGYLLKSTGLPGSGNQVLFQKQTNRKLRSPSEKLKRHQVKAELAEHDR